MPQYMVGYGSLIDEASRRRTIPDAVEAAPIVVRGYRRVWGHRMDPVGYVGATTFLTVTPDPDATVNGVVFEIPDDRLPELDIRERGYRRTLLNRHQTEAPDGDTWIYVTDPADLQAPDAEFPIIQSYLDVCMSGCIDLERRHPEACANFARDFVTTTRGWSVFWVNDRVYPRRPQRDAPHAREIDTLLRELLPAEFAAIRLDPGRA